MGGLLGASSVGFTAEGHRLKQALNTLLTIQNPRLAGTRWNGTSHIVRFIARTPWVQAHIQSTVTGAGGIVSYDAVNFTTSTLVDCRESRQQDVSFVPAVSESYIVFLIPVAYDGADTKILFDGVDGADYMSFAYFGA